MTLYFFIAWFVLGIIGAYIWNRIALYETKFVKYFWNFLVIFNGPIGLVLAILAILGRYLEKFIDKIDKKY